jgi:hypothetical protein
MKLSLLISRVFKSTSFSKFEFYWLHIQIGIAIGIGIGIEKRGIRCRFQEAITWSNLELLPIPWPYPESIPNP